MKKSIALLVAGVLAVVVLAKTTNVSSYVGTAWCKAKRAATQQVPTEFNIDRIDHELTSLDQKLDGMIRPIAEQKVAVERLRKEVADRDNRVAEQKKVLLDATAAVKAAKKGDKLVYGGKSYAPEQVKARIALDFESFRRQEAHLAAQRKLLESREATLQAAQDQLQTFMAKREEFRVQLAQLRAEHEVNKVNAVGNHVELDATPLAAIAQSLTELKDRIEADRQVLELRNNITAVNGIQLSQPQQSTSVDLDAIQAHLEGGAAPNAKATTTASK